MAKTLVAKTKLVNGVRTPIEPRKSVPYASPESAGLTPTQRANEEKAQVIRFAPTVISPLSLLKETIPKNTDKALKLSTGLQTANQTKYGAPELKTETKENNGALSAGELATLGMNPSEFDLDKKTGLYSPKASTGMTPEEKKLQDATDNADKQYDQEIGQWKSMMKGYDQLADSQIGSIGSIYDQRRAEQAEINKREQAALNTTNIMAGTQRYAPMTATSLMSASERAGMAQIQELDAEEQNLIMQAQEAAQTGKFKALDQIMTLYDKKRQTKLSLLEKQAEMAREERDKLTARKAQMDTEENLVSLIQSGITDPLELYMQANANGSETTLGEVLGVLSSVTPEAPDLGADAKDYEYAKSQGYTGGYLQYKRDSSAAGRAPVKTTGGTSTTVPTAPDAIATGFNWLKAKITDVKAEINRLFPVAGGSFGSKIISQLTDENLRQFMYEWTQVQDAEMRAIDPESFLKEWLQTVEKPKAGSASLIDQLNTAFPD